MRAFFLGFVLLLVSMFALPSEILAAGIVPCDGPDCTTCHFVDLGSNILNWLIGIMATVCAVMIVVAGFKMVTAGGNAGAVSSAKEMITNTIVGFIILLAAWLIVDTVMRTFVGDEIPNFGPWNEIDCVAQPVVTPPPPTDPIQQCEANGGIWNATTGQCEGATATTTAACSIPTLSPFTEPASSVVFTNATLQACVNRFTSRVGGTVTSAYRSPEYQTHLWEIRDRWCTRGLRYNTEGGCSTIRSAVSSEVSRHFGSNWQCGAVAQSNSTHSSGIGVDISGISHTSAAVQQAAADSCLIWRNYPNDPVHYDLRSGCTCN